MTPVNARTRLAAIYARVSTEEQAHGLVESTKTQVEKCKEKARALGIPVASQDSGLIVEEQHSGADLRWEGTLFMQLVRRAEAHDFTDLICLDIDRFCRGGADAYGQQKGLLYNAGVTVHYVMTDFGENMPFRGSMEAIMADAAQWLRDKSREASIRNRTEWARQGNITPGNTPPFGFQWVEDATRLSRKNRPVKVGLVPDPVTGPILLHMTQHVANGGGVRLLKRWLEDQGIPTPKGALVWHEETIRRILHNPTNYGARRSFMSRAVERDNAAQRPKDRKTKYRHVPTAEDEQYLVADGRVTPVPGLTRDLWAQAVHRLLENKAIAARHATRTEEERAALGLLFGGPIRCGVCGNGLRLKRTSGYTWVYYCPHTGKPAEHTMPAVQIATRKLDGIVWDTAVQAMRNPAFFERLLADTDKAVGPAVRVASLRKQLDDANRAHDKLWDQLDRLDPEDALVPDYQDMLRRNKAERDGLITSLAAAEARVEEEEARRATVAVFHAYAAEQRPTLEDKTPIEKRRSLLAIGTRCRLELGERMRRLRIAFDIRHLPGAAAWFGPADNYDDEAWFSEIDLPDTTEVDLSDVPDAFIIENDEDAASLAQTDAWALTATHQQADAVQKNVHIGDRLGRNAERREWLQDGCAAGRHAGINDGTHVAVPHKADRRGHMRSHVTIEKHVQLGAAPKR